MVSPASRGQTLSTPPLSFRRSSSHATAMFGRRADPAVVRRISGWVERAAGESSVSVVVREVQCKDINCVPIETAVLVLDGAGKCIWRGAVLKPMEEVGEEDVQALEIRETIHEQRRATKLEEIEFTIAEHVNELATNEQQLEFLESIEKVIALYRKKLDFSKSEKTFASSANVTMVPMRPKEGLEDKPTMEKPRPTTTFRLRESDDMTARHSKGTRVRGCPCCDPDNLDNVIDSYLFLQPPP